MKYCFFLFFLFSLVIVNAQKTFFNDEININDVNPSLKVSADYYNMSSKLVYRIQSSFDLEQDLRIPLVDGKTIIAKYSSTSTLKVGSVSYIYKIESDIEGLVVFTTYKNFLVGSIMLGSGERYYISQVTDTIYSFLKFNPLFFKDEECFSNPNTIDSNALKTSKLDTNFDQENEQVNTTAYNICTDAPCPNSVVDVMVFFSNQVIASLTKGEIEAVAGTSNQIVIGNQGYISSGITNLQLNLVYARALNHNDGSSLSNDKDYISTNPTLIALRNQYGADLVSLFTRTGTGTGDMPKTPTNFSGDNAYSAINYGNVIGYYSFLHETGHNLGIRHDWYEYKSDIADGMLPCPWNHGYSNLAAIALGANSSENSRWKTILSYSSHFNSVGLSSTRINRWSNPDLFYYGDPMGISASASNFPSNEKFALERSGCIVAGFRSSIVTGTCPDAPSGLSSQTVCSGSNFSAINVTGINIQWFNGPSFGTPIPITSTLEAGTYYASQIVNGCESSRLAVTVTIGSCVSITGTITGNAIICDGSSTQISISFTGQGPWSGTLSDGTSFSSSISPLSLLVNPNFNKTYTISNLSNETTIATPGHLMGSAIITVKESPKNITINASSSTTLCQGGIVNLTASAQSSSYFVKDNSNVGFIDISASGLSVGTLSDESKHLISIPKFLYNGIAYTSATVFNNGVLVFGNETGNMGFKNGDLPISISGLSNPAAICAMWDDLVPGSGTSIKTATINNKFIIQWTNEYHHDYRTSGSTFQIQLDLLSSQIHLVYLDVIFGNIAVDYAKSATIGLNLNATSALLFSWVSASLSNNQSISYGPHATSWSDGQTTPKITVSKAGDFTVKLTNNNGCSVTSAVKSVTIDNSCIALSASISGDNSICIGSATQLNIATVGQGPWSGTLSDGTVFSGNASPITVSVSPLASTMYTIASLSNASTSIAPEYLYNSAYVVVNPSPALPTITANNPTTFCQGSSLNLSVSALPNAYNVNSNSNISFIDISSIGNSIGTISDDSKNVITIPNFLYYGIGYTSATIFNDGILVFGNETGTLGLQNGRLPNSFSALTNRAVICAMWDDLYPGSGTSIKTATVDNKFIIQWTNEFHFTMKSSGTITFQIQLNLSSGEIHLVNKDVIFGNSTFDKGKSATIGLNFTSSSALQYSYNLANLTDNQSITYSPAFPVWTNGQTTSVIAISTSGNYSVRVTDLNGCSASSAVTVVTVNPIPSKPSGANSPQYLCYNSTIADLAVSGTNIKWYPGSSGGAVLATSTAITPTTYYASQTVNGCESNERSAVNAFLTDCNSKVGISTASPKSTLDLNGSFARKVTKLTSSTSLTTNYSVLLCDSGSPITLTLPSALNLKGRDYVVKNISSGTVTLAAASGELIDLQNTILLSLNKSITVISDGIGWKIIKYNN